MGEQLVRAVIDWAAEQGFDRLRLWVAEGNHRAERLYSRLGFARTGEVQAMGRRQTAKEFGMVRALDGLGATEGSSSQRRWS